MIPGTRESNRHFPEPTVVTKLYLFQTDVVDSFVRKEIGHVLLGQLRRLFYVHSKLSTYSVDWLILAHVYCVTASRCVLIAGELRWR